MKKRAITAVVATMLIILINVAAISIIWAWSGGYIKDTSQRAAINAKFAQEKFYFTSVGREGSQVNVLVKRGSTDLLAYVTNLDDSNFYVDAPVDLAFILDNTAAMATDLEPGVTRTEASQIVIKQLAQSMNQQDKEEQFTLTTFGPTTKVDQPLAQGVVAIYSAVDNIPPSSGPALIDEALKTTHQYLINNAREKSVKSIIIITNGNNLNGAGNLISNGTATKNDNIIIATVGVDTPDLSLQAIASTIDGKELYYPSQTDTNTLITSFDEIYNILKQTKTNNKIVHSPEFLQLIFSNGKEDYTVIERNVPLANEQKSYLYNLPPNLENFNKITLHLGVRVGTKEFLSDPLVVWER